MQRSLDILLISGSSSTPHLGENIAGAGPFPSDDDRAELDKIGR